MSSSAQKSHVYHPNPHGVEVGVERSLNKNICYKLHDICRKVMFSNSTPLTGMTEVGRGSFPKISFAKNSMKYPDLYKNPSSQPHPHGCGVRVNLQEKGFSLEIA